MRELPGFDKSLRVACVLDPRFPGGTSTAVAAELEALAEISDIHVHAIDTSMFSGHTIAPRLREVIARRRLPLTWDAPEIAADVVIFHNPSCLKFQDNLASRFLARHLIVVTHENFQRPGGEPAFDVNKCLGIIASNSFSKRRSLAPVSDWNRQTVDAWQQQTSDPAGWHVLDENWINVCAFDLVPPTAEPRDRRGRHSRAGYEKFPDRTVLELCFSRTADSNIILGADSLMRMNDTPDHWSLHAFGALTLRQFFEKLDFFVYFTAPTWRESFGRAIAEAVAAGKLVITDRETARPFQGGVVAAEPQEIDTTIARFIAHPEQYREHVLTAQRGLNRYSAEAFRSVFRRNAAVEPGGRA